MLRYGTLRYGSKRTDQCYVTVSYVTLREGEKQALVLPNCPLYVCVACDECQYRECVCVSVCTREPISVGSYVCTRHTVPGPVALLGPNLRPNRVFH